MTITLDGKPLPPQSKASVIRKLGGEGILTVDDIPDLTSQRGKVLALMADGQWHSGPDIVAASGGSEGLRRLRELRNIPGCRVFRRRDYAKRMFWYRLDRQ